MSYSQHDVKKSTLESIRRSVAVGLTKEAFERQKYLLIAPGITVHNYVQTCVDFGEFIWDGNTLVFNSRNEKAVDTAKVQR